MAAALLNEKCQFPPTEINHDLNPPLTTSLSSKGPFKEIYATSIGECEKNTMYNNNFKLLNDMNMVSYVFFPQNINTIKTVPTLPNHTVVINFKTDSGPTLCKIEGFNKPYTNSVFELFTGFNDIFL